MGTLDGTVSAEISVEESVTGMVEVLKTNMGCRDHRYLDWKGNTWPW